MQRSLQQILQIFCNRLNVKAFKKIIYGLTVSARDWTILCKPPLLFYANTHVWANNSDTDRLEPTQDDINAFWESNTFNNEHFSTLSHSILNLRDLFNIYRKHKNLLMEQPCLQPFEYSWRLRNSKNPLCSYSWDVNKCRHYFMESAKLLKHTKQTRQKIKSSKRLPILDISNLYRDLG